MGELLGGSALFSVFLTLGAYQIGLWCRRRWNSPLCNPILIAVVLVIAVLGLSGVPNSEYQRGYAGLSWLLTPATVCLAVPLYRQVQVLRRDLAAVAAGVLAGTAASLASIFLLAKLFRLGPVLTVSLLPKSITTAMGIAVADSAGGVSAVTTAAIIATGILGSLCGPWLCRFFRLRHPVARGVAFGTASHVIGTAKAAELDEVSGAAGSLALILAGVVTVAAMPLLAPLC